MEGGDNPAAGARRPTVKKGIDLEQQRRRRENHLVEIRKKKVEEQLSKRRTFAIEDLPTSDDTLTGTTPAAAPAHVSTLEIARYAELVIHGADEAAKLEGAQSFRKLLSAEKNPPIDDVIHHGVLPYLVSFLAVDASPKLQFEAAWSLTNVASGTSTHTKAVIQAGAIPQFVRLLASPHEDVREQATWALGNIAGDSPECRNLVLSHGVLDPLISIIQPTARLSVLRNATWTLSNLCRGKPAPDFRLVGRALPILAAVIHSNDQDVLCDGLWALSYLSDGPNDRVAAVLEAGVLNRVVELLAHPAQQVVTPALRTVGNIVTGDDLQTQAVLNAGALPHLHRLMTHNKKALRKEACWTLSNIMAGTQAQIQAVIDANCIQVLVSILEQNTVGETDVRKEATWAICNGTSCGNPNQIAFMVQCGVIPLLTKQLQAHDPRLAGVIVEGFENILRAGARDPANPALENPYVAFMEEANVPDALHTLDQEGAVGDDVSTRIGNLLSTYFGDYEEGDEPGTDGATFGGTTDATTAQQWGGPGFGGGWPGPGTGGTGGFGGFGGAQFR